MPLKAGGELLLGQRTAELRDGDECVTAHQHIVDYPVHA